MHDTQAITAAREDFSGVNSWQSLVAKSNRMSEGWFY